MESLIRKGPPPAGTASLLPLLAVQPCPPLLAPAVVPLINNGAVTYTLTAADVFVTCASHILAVLDSTGGT